MLGFLGLVFAFSAQLHAEPEPEKKPAPEAALKEEDQAALEIGRAVMAVDRALEYKLPESPTPEQKAEAERHTEAMVGAGQLTRLYPWVRSRIDLEIKVTESLLRDTNPDAARTRELKARIEYLGRVRLRIDAPR